MNNLDFNFFCDFCPKDTTYRLENCFTDYSIKNYVKGELITNRGDIAKVLSILVSGTVRVSIVLESGLALNDGLHSAPTALGLIALFADNNYYRITVVAETKCQVISVSKDTIEKHIVECTTFRRNYLAKCMSKVDVFCEHLNLLTHKGLKSRLAYYILSKSHVNRYNLGMKIGDLAYYLRVERPSLSRAIQELVDAEIITYYRGEGKILNISALRLLVD